MEGLVYKNVEDFKYLETTLNIKKLLAKKSK